MRSRDFENQIEPVDESTGEEYWRKQSSSSSVKTRRRDTPARRDLEEVDNVPLLVGQFTDCDPEVSREMLEIMQENEEVDLTVGSSLNISNTAIFSKLLNISPTVTGCRHRIVSIRSALLFVLMASAQFSILLFSSAFLALPFIFTTSQIFLTVFVQIPLLCVAIIWTPFTPKHNVIRIASKFILYLATNSIPFVYPLSLFCWQLFFATPAWIIGFLSCIFLLQWGLHRIMSYPSMALVVSWIIIMIILNDICKMKNIRTFLLEQRRTKLAFNTKLGMNSPY